MQLGLQVGMPGTHDTSRGRAMRGRTNPMCPQMSQESREALGATHQVSATARREPRGGSRRRIVGGGVAALTLALEIRRRARRTRILIVEPNPIRSPRSPIRSANRPSRCPRTICAIGLAWATTCSPPTFARWACGCSSPTTATPISRNDWNSEFDVRPADHLPDRPRQAGERTPSPLPGGGRRHRHWRVRSVDLGRRQPAHPVRPERRRRHARPRPAGWSTRRAATGCCPGNWT